MSDNPTSGSQRQESKVTLAERHQNPETSEAGKSSTGGDMVFGILAIVALLLFITIIVVLWNDYSILRFA